MMNNKKIIFAVIFLYVLFSCKKDESNLLHKNQKITIKTDIKNFSYSFNPYLAKNEVEKIIICSIFSSLFYINPDTGFPENNLIDKYTLTDQGKVYYFKLKRNIKFHDGTSLTSYDVEASLNLLKTVLKNRELYNSIFFWNTSFEVEIVNENEFKIILDKPNSFLPYILTDYPILKKSTTLLLLNSYNFCNDIYRLIPVKDAIGTGPYYISKIEKNKICLNKNKEYFKKDLPLTSSIEIRFVENKELKTDSTIDIYLTECCKKKFKFGYKLLSGNSKGSLIIAFNPFGTLSDYKLRKILYEALMEYYKTKNTNKIKEKIKEEYNKLKLNENLNIKILINNNEEKKIFGIASSLKKILPEKIKTEVISLSYNLFLEKISKKEEVDITLFYTLSSDYLSIIKLLKSDFSFINTNSPENSLELEISKRIEEILLEKDIVTHYEKINRLNEILADNFLYNKIFEEEEFYLVSKKIKNISNFFLKDSLILNTLEHMYKK